MHFQRHVGSVCSTVVWRVCVYFHMHVGSVFHSCVEAKFPQALGECEFPSSCNGFVCIFKGMWGVCVPQLCGGTEN